MGIDTACFFYFVDINFHLLLLVLLWIVLFYITPLSVLENILAAAVFYYIFCWQITLCSFMYKKYTKIIKRIFQPT